MMKFWRKVLSLGIVAVLLLTMIPAGIFTASGLNYAKSEFSICNLKDWNDVASSSENFAGKTVKLTADFDAGGAELVTLFESFAGTFDGQGYTIRNFKATGALIATETTAGAVIKNLKIENGAVSGGDAEAGAGMLIGAHDGSGSLTVTDCSIAGTVSSSSYYVGGLIGKLAMNDGTSATIERISMNASVSSTTAGLTRAWQGAGGLVGYLEPTGKIDLVIRSIRSSGSVTTKIGTLGGLIGSAQTPSGQLYAGGTILLANCECNAEIKSYDATVDNGVFGVGGLIGSFGVLKYYSGENYFFAGDLKVENCVIGGSIAHTVSTDSGAAKMGVGGVVGSIGFADVTMRVDHCLIRASFPKNNPSLTDGTGGALILGFAGALTKTALTVNNTVSTVQGSMVGAALAKPDTDVPGDYYAWLYLNETDFAKCPVQTVGHTNNVMTNNRYILPAISDGSVLMVTEAKAEKMIKKDTAGFINRIGGQLTALAIQTSAITNDENYAVRFIAITHLESVQTAQMNILVRETATGEEIKYFTTDCTLYDGLNAYDENGVKVSYYGAKDFGGTKFLALTITGIPKGVAYSFEVVPSLTTNSDTVVSGNPMSVSFDQNGTHLPALDHFEAAPFERYATVRVMSSNVLAHADSHAADKNLTTTQRLNILANTYLFYEPDFIGLQEMNEKTDGGNGAQYYYEMHTELMQLIGEEYTMVDVTSKIAVNKYWTPIVYRTDRWRLVEWDVDTEVINDMFRWTWALYESKEDPNTRFIHLNLHGPNARMEDQKPAYFAEINSIVKNLSQKYPNVAIAITGDYNLNITMTHFETLMSGTKLENSKNCALDSERYLSTGSNRSIYDVLSISAGIDHILVTTDCATVKKYRVLQNTKLGAVSDHNPIYVDIYLGPMKKKGEGSLMDWGEGVIKNR